MSHQETKTYGKQTFKESAATHAFDKIFSSRYSVPSKCIKPTTAMTQVHRWGQASFTSKRANKDVGSSNGAPIREEDPFSFDSEDSPRTTKKGKGKYSISVINPKSVANSNDSNSAPLTVSAKRTYKKPTLRSTTINIPAPVIEVINLPDNGERMDVKIPVKTYSRTPKATPPPSMPMLKPEEPSPELSLPSNELTPTDDLQQLVQDNIIDCKSTMPVLEPFTEMSYEQSSKCRYKKKKENLENDNANIFLNDTPISMDEKEKIEDDFPDDSQEIYVKNRYKTSRNTRLSNSESVTFIRVSPPSWYTKQKTDVSSESIVEKDEKEAKMSDEAKMRKMQKEIDELLAGEEIIESPKKPAAKVRKFFRSRNRDKKYIQLNDEATDSSSQDVPITDSTKSESCDVSECKNKDSVSESVETHVSNEDDVTAEGDHHMRESSVELKLDDKMEISDIDSGDNSGETNADKIACDVSLSTVNDQHDNNYPTTTQLTEEIDSLLKSPRTDTEDVSMKDSSNVGSQEYSTEVDNDEEDMFDCIGPDGGEPKSEEIIEISSDLSAKSSQRSSANVASDVGSKDNAATALPSRLIKSSSQSPKPTDDNKIFKSKNGAELKPTQGSDLSGKRIFSSPGKKLGTKAAYNVRTWHADSEDSTKRIKLSSSEENSMLSEFDASDQRDQLLSRAVHWPNKVGDEAVTSLHVKREHKELFTVVRNVKQAHECQESGETQEFTDDIEYLLTGLPSTEPLSSRCLSCISFSTKCLLPAFRMHLRAHGIYTTIFGELHDAHTYPSLALCTSLLLLMMSRDRINNELDTDILNLMLKLLGVDSHDETNTSSKMSESAARDYRRTREKVIEILERLENQEKRRHFDYDNIAPGNLVMEALLSLTAKNTGILFKEELRVTGALDHITDTVCHCVERIERDQVKDFGEVNLELLHKIERCLRVLENATYSNSENQAYLVFYQKAQLMTSLSTILAACVDRLPTNPVEVDAETKKVNKDSTGWSVFSCTLSVLKVLLNVTHNNALASTAVGKQDRLLSSALSCVVSIPHFVQCSEQFDLFILSLGLLINLCEHCEINRRVLFTSDVVVLYNSNLKPPETKLSMNALIELFQQRDEAARLVEERGELAPNMGGPSSQPTAGTSSQGTDNKGGVWKESKSGLEWVVIPDDGGEDAEVGLLDQSGSQDMQVLGSQEEDDDFTKALHRAGRHMEDSIVAAYVAILIGCVIQGNTTYMDQVKEKLPEEDFSPMIKILKKFYGFVTLTSSIGTAGNKSLVRVIEVLESC